MYLDQGKETAGLKEKEHYEKRPLVRGRDVGLWCTSSAVTVLIYRRLDSGRVHR